MQQRNATFARANNIDGLGIYGDPERWGATADLTVPAGQGIFSEQIVRAQCADLYATGWDVMITWTQAGGTTLDPDVHLFTCAAELTIGNGSSTTTLTWAPIRNGVRASAFTALGITGPNTADPSNPYHGAALITVPANSIAGRVACAISGGDQGDFGRFQVCLSVAPRVGVR